MKKSTVGKSETEKGKTLTYIGVVFLIIMFIVLTQYDFRGPASEDVTLAVQQEDYSLARIVEIKDEGSIEIHGQQFPYQLVNVEVIDGPDAGKVTEVRNEVQPGSEESSLVSKGETVVVTKSTADGEERFFIADRYRFPAVIVIFLIFLALIIIFAGWRGISAVIGLGFTILILINYVVPRIVAGDDPMVVSIVGTFFIGLVSFYLAHGFRKRVSIAFASTIITIVIAIVLATVFVDMAQLFGTGSEEALLLNVGTAGSINLKGLLLGGIIFGVLGVLDDVTTAQTAAIEELKKANQKLGFKELYTRSISIGREHIVSLVNTLVLAYIGSSFPILLLFSLNQGVPLWLTLNSEFIIEEVIRTLVGSTALIFAVPITTVMAAYFYANASKKSLEQTGEAHTHKH